VILMYLQRVPALVRIAAADERVAVMAQPAL